MERTHNGVEMIIRITETVYSEKTKIVNPLDNAGLIIYIVGTA